MALTEQQISDLRTDIADVNSAFSEAALNRIWDRVAGARDDNARHEAALGLMARQLLANANLLHDYTAGQSSEKLSQVRAHLKDQYEMYRPALEAALNQKKQFVIGSIAPVPSQVREYPDESLREYGEYDTGLL